MLLVALGNKLSDDIWNKTKSEVINLSNSPKSCNDLPPYPYEISGAAGTIVGSVPIISGGISKNPIRIYSQIYKFDLTTGNWILLGNLKSPRYQHSSVPLYSGVFVMGGRDNNGTILKSTELISLNGTVTSQINLPTPRSGHCSVLLEDGNGDPGKVLIMISISSI